MCPWDLSILNQLGGKDCLKEKLNRMTLQLSHVTVCFMEFKTLECFNVSKLVFLYRPLLQSWGTYNNFFQHLSRKNDKYIHFYSAWRVQKQILKKLSIKCSKSHRAIKCNMQHSLLFCALTRDISKHAIYAYKAGRCGSIFLLVGYEDAEWQTKHQLCK